MLKKKPIIRTNNWHPGCVIPVGWVLESILLILLVCAVRDLSSNVERMTRAVLLVAAQALPWGHGHMSDLQGKCEEDGR